jgi:uncharacterized protein with von Willebrand factor type A (vWA) domain
MKKHFMLVLCMFGGFAFSQSTTPVQGDPSSPSSYLTQITANGVPTMQDVENLGQVAKTAFGRAENPECKDNAEAKLEAWRTASNWLANLLAQTNEPFYNALSSERRNPSVSINKLAEVERSSNNLKEFRNEATVMLAECHLKSGNKAAALSSYLAVLNILDIDEGNLWERARRGIFQLTGYKPIVTLQFKSMPMQRKK